MAFQSSSEKRISQLASLNKQPELLFALIRTGLNKFPHQNGDISIDNFHRNYPNSISRQHPRMFPYYKQHEKPSKTIQIPQSTSTSTTNTTFTDEA